MEITCSNCDSVWGSDQEIFSGNIIELLECPICNREEEEAEPEIEPVKVPVKPELKERIRKEMMTKPSREIKRARFKYPDGLRNFCIKNIDKMSNPELVEAANKEFDLDMDYNRLASYKKYNNIKRSKEVKKEPKILPPEDDY